MPVHILFLSKSHVGIFPNQIPWMSSVLASLLDTCIDVGVICHHEIIKYRYRDTLTELMHEHGSQRYRHMYVGAAYHPCKRVTGVANEWGMKATMI